MSRRAVFTLAILALAWCAPAPACAEESDTKSLRLGDAPAPSAPAAPGAESTLLDHLFTAQEWQAQGNITAAREAVLAALAENPDDTYAAIRLCQLDAAGGNLQQGLEGLNAVLARDPGNVLALVWQGHLLLALDRPAAAAASYAQAARLAPLYGWPHAGLAACLLRQGKAHQAVAELEKAQAAPAEDAELHYALGGAYAELGLLANARMELELALEYNPRHQAALVRAGEVYQRLGLGSLALGAWRQALSLNPADKTALHHLLAATGLQAAQAHAAGRMDQAVLTWRIMLSYDPTNAQALYHLRALGPAKPGG